MNEETEFTIGSDVVCSDGDCGVLRRVVIDPVDRALTHLVVEPAHGVERGHLVPVDLVVSVTKAQVRLSCTTSQFEGLEEAEETQFVPGGDGQWGYEPDQMLYWPYYGLGVGPYGMGGLGVDAGLGMGLTGPQAITNDRVPMGEVEVRRGEHVFATDGAIGRVQGLVVHPSDHHVTHVLLDEGHLWGQKRVAIPISAVKNIDDGVQVALTKDEVRDLPPVEVDESRAP
ncbi:MAG: PRC-barrel domain-containing protein [Acidimicrobiales bacterium]|jgi:sporulation protein YlmC with PRC-barrel domain